MVDSRKGKAMADEVGSVAERVQVLELKIEQLAASVRSGFNGVDEAFADQRLCTELAVARVGTEIQRLDSRVDERFSRLERRLERVMDLHLMEEPTDVTKRR